MKREGRRQKRKTQAELFWKFEALLFSTRPEKRLGQRGEQSSAVAAGAVCVHTSAMRQALERRERELYDVMGGSGAKSRDKSRPARIVVRVTPIGVASHTRL